MYAIGLYAYNENIPNTCIMGCPWVEKPTVNQCTYIAHNMKITFNLRYMYMYHNYSNSTYDPI